LAHLADRTNRRNVLAAAIGVWSIMTALCGWAQNYMQLLLARIGVGIGESGGTAQSYAIISDYFPPQRRAWVLGIFSTSIYVGIMLSMLGGGWIAQHYGWRTAFLILGPVGVALAVLVQTTVAEPERGRFETEPATSEKIGDAFRFLMGQKGFLLVVGGLTAMSVTLGAFAAWAPTLLIRAHGMSLASVGASFGLILGVFGAAGALLGGFLADRLGERWASARALFPAVACVASVPFFAGFCLAGAPGPALAIYAVAVVASGMHFGPAFALTQNLAKPGVRSLAASIAMLMTNIGANGIGPLMVGALSDMFAAERGARALGYALLPSTAFAVIGAILFLAALRHIPGDAERAAGG
jgi:MFS family permease